MAIVTMANAVAGNVASAAEYNKIVSNVYDLDSRTTTATSNVSSLSTSLTNLKNVTGTSALESRATNGQAAYTATSNGTYGNTALDARLNALETAAPANGKITRTASGAGQAVGPGSYTNLLFGAQLETPVGVSYSNGLFTFTKYGRWLLNATVAFSVIPDDGGVFALRFKQGSANYGQNVANVIINTQFGAGTSASWTATIDNSNAVWSVELVMSLTPAISYAVAPDSRTAFTATYLGPTI